MIFIIDDMKLEKVFNLSQSRAKFPGKIKHYNISIICLVCYELIYEKLLKGTTTFSSKTVSKAIGT